MKGNKKNSIIPCAVVITFLSILISVSFFSNDEFAKPNTIYQIYLDGEKIGLIEDKEKLYNLINEEQSDIKDSYSVDQVYPPNGFSIEKYTTYKDNITEVSTIYEKIKEEKDFTIKGYTITIKPQKTEDSEGNPLSEEDMAPKYIHVLEKEIFDEAIHKFVTTFLSEEQYNNYINGTQPEVVDIGKLIETMNFLEVITVKESYISVDEKIYTDVNDLTHYLLYGNETKEEEYIVKKGDTVSSISYDNKINEQEFLIANPDIPDENTILAIGRKVTIAIINPQLTLSYDAQITEDQEIPYETETRVDYSKWYGYQQVIQPGINGVRRITKSVRIENGAELSGANITNQKVIKSAQNKIVVVGRKTVSVEQPIDVDPNASWAWPTITPYVITSPYGYRGGTLHNGMDISGTGAGSPIYAILDGEVIIAQYGGPMGRNSGNNVVIKHDNGYYSVYAHLQSISVKPGDRVTKKQRIGGMGRTGLTTGTHLHLSVSVGMPYTAGYYFINPKTLWNMR
ncbi:MAG: peptidoglycan DD-metalloendopeptidase family protein [Bacilli bacterium]